MSQAKMLEFQNDFRKSNPKLHLLHVTYAMEELEVLEEFIERLSDFSRVNSSIIAGMVNEEVQKNCSRDAAWFEAVGRRRAGIDIPYEEKIDKVVVNNVED